MTPRSFIPPVMIVLLLTPIVPLVAHASSGPDVNVVSEVHVQEAGEGTVVRVVGSRAPTFTQFSLDRPPRLVLDLTTSALEGPARVQGAGPVSSVRVESFRLANAPLVRVTIELAGTRTYDIRAEGNDLVVMVGDVSGAALVSRVDLAREAPEASDPKEEARRQAREEALQRALLEEQERIDREEAEHLAREEAEKRALEEAREAERLAREREERLAREEQDQLAREEQDQLAREEQDQLAREEQDQLAREEQERAASEADERLAPAPPEHATMKKPAAAPPADPTPRDEDGAALAAEQERSAREEARMASEEELRRARQAEIEREQAAQRSRRDSPPARASTARAAPSAGPSFLSLVGFRAPDDDGVSRVFVHTSGVVDFTVVDDDPNVLTIELENTKPRTRNDLNALDTSFFETVVERVDVEEVPGALRIVVRLKEGAAHEVRQDGNEISLEFRTRS